jgi:ATP phosphoribosyltransferase
MKNLITIGLPSKGRLKDKSIAYFRNKGFVIIQSDKERNYFAFIENQPNMQIIYLHAKEIIQRLGDGTLDAGISGLDLLNESEKNLQDKIIIKKKLDFGEASLVVAVPDDWIDVQTIADLEEVAFDIRYKRNTRLRVATKYPNLTNDFLISKGVTQYKLISSLGATETYPFIGSSEVITDITSTGKTLEDNNLRVLKDGLILKSTACILVSKKSLQNKNIKIFLSMFLKKVKKIKF